MPFSLPWPASVQVSTIVSCTNWMRLNKRLLWNREEEGLEGAAEEITHIAGSQLSRGESCHTRRSLNLSSAPFTLLQQAFWMQMTPDISSFVKGVWRVKNSLPHHKTFLIILREKTSKRLYGIEPYAHFRTAPRQKEMDGSWMMASWSQSWWRRVQPHQASQSWRRADAQLPNAYGIVPVGWVTLHAQRPVCVWQTRDAATLWTNWELLSYDDSSDSETE